jgi:hypothetical protein
MTNYGLGLIKSPPDARDFKITDLPLELAETLPPRYLAWKNVTAPVVLDQGTTPQCVAYSNSATRQFQEYLDKGVRFDFDEPWFYAQCKAIDGIPNSPGTYVRAAMKVLKNKGFSTVGTNGADAGRHKISAYYSVPVTPVDIKRALKTYGPVQIGSRWFKSWFRPMLGGRLPYPVQEIGGHATTIWGYDDILGVFYCRNSWGSSWGWRGDFLLPYEYTRYVFEAWKTVDLPDKPVEPVPTPTPTPAPTPAPTNIVKRTIGRFVRPV